MLDVSEAVTRAALVRQESRGAHTREDFPDSDDKWGKLNVIIRKQDGQMAVVLEPLPEMPPDLRQIMQGSEHG